MIENKIIIRVYKTHALHSDLTHALLSKSKHTYTLTHTPLQTSSDDRLALQPTLLYLEIVRACVLDVLRLYLNNLLNLVLFVLF
jgi:hypothetical protein